MLGKAICANKFFGYASAGAQIPLVGIGTNGAMFLKLFTQNKWLPSGTDWFEIYGNFDSVPTAWQSLYLTDSAFEAGFLGLGVDYKAYQSVLDLVNWPPVPLKGGAVGPSNWEPLGGVFNSPLDAKAFGYTEIPEYNTALAVVGLGTDNQPYLYAGVSNQDTGDPTSPQGWLPLGNKFIYEPVIATHNVVDPSNNSFDIFGVGTDRQMYHMTIDGTRSPIAPGIWQPSGGCFISAPAAFGAGARIDVFGVGTDNAMYHRALINGAWQGGWESLGGSFESCAAVTGGVNPVDVFGIQTDKQMYHKWWDGAHWMPNQTDWAPLGGQFICVPAAVTAGGVAFGEPLAGSPPPLRVDLFGIGTDNQMWHKAWTDGPDWVPPKLDWEPLGGKFKIPRQTLLPSELSLSSQITFNGNVAFGGNVQVTISEDGTSTFSGQVHDSGFTDYTYVIVCRVIDSKNNAYQFVQTGSVAGTVSPGESRNSTWSLVGKPMQAIADGWESFFPCGGIKLSWWANVDTYLDTLLASVGTAGLTSVLNVAFQ